MILTHLSDFDRLTEGIMHVYVTRGVVILIIQTNKRGAMRFERLGEIWKLSLKPQDSFGRIVKNCLDLQKVDHTIRKHH